MVTQQEIEALKRMLNSVFELKENDILLVELPSTRIHR